MYKYLITDWITDSTGASGHPYDLSDSSSISSARSSCIDSMSSVSLNTIVAAESGNKIFEWV